ncbi:hypothetical protein FIBSPDRAFT_868217, partial [Athelia psychrophila]
MGRSRSCKPGRPGCRTRCYVWPHTRKGERMESWAGARFLWLGDGLIARTFNEALSSRM